MEEAAAVRRAASEATADVEPGALRETIAECAADGSVVPGVLTLLSARQTAGEDPEDLSELAAGVQLIYDGLRLTRALAHEDPWHAADVPAVAGDGAGERSEPGSDAADRDDADMAILAADVLVSRGFYVLARTDAASDAVAVVRAFGRDQTERERAVPCRAVDLDRNLERDVLELAVTTGVTAGGATATGVAHLAAEYAPAEPSFAPAETFVDDDLRARLAGLAIDGGRPLNRND